jgi:hypothetical protein
MADNFADIFAKVLAQLSDTVTRFHQSDYCSNRWLSLYYYDRRWYRVEMFQGAVSNKHEYIESRSYVRNNKFVAGWPSKSKSESYLSWSARCVAIVKKHWSDEAAAARQVYQCIYAGAMAIRRVRRLPTELMMVIVGLVNS